MTMLLGFRPTTDDLAQFRHLLGHLQRRAGGEQVVTASSVLRYALYATAAGIAANGAPHGPLGERRRDGRVRLGASD